MHHPYMWNAQCVSHLVVQYWRWLCHVGTFTRNHDEQRILFVTCALGITESRRMDSFTHQMKNHNRSRKGRGQPELNRWPLDLQSNALPLSYTPSADERRLNFNTNLAQSNPNMLPIRLGNNEIRAWNFISTHAIMIEKYTPYSTVAI